jgi:hypothetical protein
VLERAKTVRALDRLATAIGLKTDDGEELFEHLILFIFVFSKSIRVKCTNSYRQL